MPPPGSKTHFGNTGVCTTAYGLFVQKNHQATQSSPTQSRSESAIAINRQSESRFVGASKKFIDPAKYHFGLAPIWTDDSGATWHESTLPMKAGWDGMTDPTVAFDHFGHAFLIGEPLVFGTDLVGQGMVVYRSTDSGKTWEQPKTLTTATKDDKQWVQCDNNPNSPFYGHVYVVFGAWGPLRFSRSTDHGETWKGRAAEPPGSELAGTCFAPEIAISPDGTLHIFWHNDGGSEIRYVHSTDGGETFSNEQVIVQGMSSLRGNLPSTNGWPHFEHAKFRVITLVTSCAGTGKDLFVAWADMREGRSRIYYRHSSNGGTTWLGPASGQPLLPNSAYGPRHCFHPQIVCTDTGVVGCAYYTFGQAATGAYLIDVDLAASWDGGNTFDPPVTVSDAGWDPLVNAPKSHGDAAVDFIGEYFGMDAGYSEFALLWTDTRTGVQELRSAVVETERTHCRRIPEISAEILFGVIQDGGGWVIIGGKLVRIPPRQPLIRILKQLVGQRGEATEEQAEQLRASVVALQRQR
jgi:hypothetical protein